MALALRGAAEVPVKLGIIPHIPPAPMNPNKRVPASASRMSAHSAQSADMDAWFWTPSLYESQGREGQGGRMGRSSHHDNDPTTMTTIQLPTSYHIIQTANSVWI